MLEEFKKFALRGNAVDLAIGVIIGGAFGAVVNSLVGDILSPIIGAVTGGFDFSNYFIPLSSKVTADSLVEAKKQGAVLAWGNFLTVVINFIIIAWILFLVVRLMNQLIHSEPQAPALTRQEMLLTEIRDLLKRRQEGSRPGGQIPMRRQFKNVGPCGRCGVPGEAIGSAPFLRYRFRAGTRTPHGAGGLAAQ